MLKYRIVKTNIEGQEYFKIEVLKNEKVDWQEWKVLRKEKDIPHVAPKKPDPNQEPDLMIRDYSGDFMAVPVYKSLQKAQNQIAYLTNRVKEKQLKEQLENIDWKVVARTEVEVEVNDD